MRVAVTGSAGYIGSRLVGRLRRAGHEVLALDREPNAAPEANTFLRCDLTDPATYGQALLGIDLLCHLAAAKGDWGISADDYNRDNILATRALADSARRAGVRR